MSITSVQNSSANKNALALATGAVALNAVNYKNYKTLYNSDVFLKGANLKTKFQNLKNLFKTGQYVTTKSGARLMNPVKFSKGRLISTIALCVAGAGMTIGAIVNAIKANKSENKQD